jgi:hypothetical protein
VTDASLKAVIDIANTAASVIERLRVENEQLLAALRKYARHEPHCEFWKQFPKDCTCGLYEFAKARGELAKAEKPTQDNCTHSYITLGGITGCERCGKVFESPTGTSH